MQGSKKLWTVVYSYSKLKKFSKSIIQYSTVIGPEQQNTVGMIGGRKQAVAELGHTRVPNCQLGQCSDQVERDRIGMVLVIKRNF